MTKQVVGDSRNAAAKNGRNVKRVGHTEMIESRSPLLLAALFACAPAAVALDNGLGLRPAMGFSTWNHFQGAIGDALLREVADAMVSSGLLAAGYEYLNLDDGWNVGRDANGSVVPDPKLFPQGMAAVVDYVHSKGLKFGIYTARGSTTCMGRAGSDSHEQQDADTYAAWGVDYLKVGLGRGGRESGSRERLGPCCVSGYSALT